jgi:cytochrome c-type biogenesis protein CcmH
MNDRISVGRRLKGWPGWVLLLFVVVGFLAVGSTRDRGEQTPDDRIASITKRIACPVCSGESVFESRNTASENIRNAVEERVEAGQLSDNEIIAYVQSRQGASLLLVPENSGFDALVWALPAAAGVCAIGGLIVAFRRWRDAELRTPDPTDADRALVAEALADDDSSPGDETLAATGDPSG